MKSPEPVKKPEKTAAEEESLDLSKVSFMVKSHLIFVDCRSLKKNLN